MAYRSVLFILFLFFPECVAKGSCFKWGSGGVWTVFATRVRERLRLLVSTVPLGFAAKVSRGFAWQVWGPDAC